MEESKPKKPRSKAYSRTKGHNAEREWAERFRDVFGFTFCKTSRNASKLLDDSKVDLAFIPLNVQIKKGYDKQRPKFDKIFEEMEHFLKKHFPPGDPQRTYPKVLIQDIDFRKPEHVGITLMWEDFKTIYLGYIHWQMSQMGMAPLQTQNQQL